MIRGKQGCPLCEGTGTIYYGHCSAMHAVTCNCAYEKPHIKVGRIMPWKCEGFDRMTTGATAREAYENWVATGANAYGHDHWVSP